MEIYGFGGGEGGGDGQNGGAVRGRMRRRIDVWTWLVLHSEGFRKVSRCLEEWGCVYG